MKVLVTGAHGCVARAIIPVLGSEHELVLFARQPPDEAASQAYSARWVAGDLNVLDDCRRAAAGVEAIVHLGGRPVPRPDTFQVNVLGTYHVLEAARAMGVRHVVLASSMCALGNCFRTSGAPFELEYLPVDEAHPMRIEDSYGLSKYLGERMLESYTRAHNLRGTALRLCWCWGPAEIEWRRRAAPDLAQYQSGFWAYVDLRDAAQAFRRALDTQEGALPYFGIYCISAADTFADEPSADLVNRYYPQYRRLATALKGTESFVSWRAAEAAFGYAPQYSWRP